MAKRTHRTARGKAIDMESLRLANENTIAVGNMKVNARGDELGFGGKVVRSRKDVMEENYKVHTMVPKDDVVYKDADEGIAASQPKVTGVETPKQAEPEVKVDRFFAEDANDPAPEPQVMRGGLAAALAKKVQMTEPEVKPAGINDGSTGVKRI
jgi:hypothetical protein